MAARQAPGFTLVEVLLSVTVFSLGILVIFPSFFKSMQLLSVLAGRYPADLAANNVIVEAEERLRSEGRPPQRKDSRDIVLSGRTYHVETETAPQESSERLYRIDVLVSWKGFRNEKISSAADILR
jgi:prepilin-type N-terminal cleavage/methylation domain-containing protein